MKISRKKTALRSDVAKSMRISSSLKQLSFEKRATELNSPTKIRFNVKGNQRGMHMAGESEQMQRLRAMRKMWNRKMPVMHCNNCSFSQQCPQFKAGYECAFNRFFDAHTIANESDLIFYAKEMATQGVKRAQKMLLAETLSGGAPSLETTEALSVVFAQLMQLYDRVTETAEVEIESSDTTIIGKLFGGLGGLMEATSEAIRDPVHIPTSNAESLLVEDTGAIDVPLEVTQAPRKVFDSELLKSYAGAQVKAKPTEELMPT